MTPQSIAWAELPTEMKLEILRPCLVTQQPISGRTHNEVRAPRLVKYSLVSKEMHALATEIYYKENTFRFSRSSISATSPITFHFPKAHIGPLLRRIELHIKLPTGFSTLEELFKHKHWAGETDRAATDMLALVRPHRAQLDGEKYILPYAGGTKYISRTQDLGFDNGRYAVPGGMYVQKNVSLPARYNTKQERVVRCWSNENTRHAKWQKDMPNLENVKIVVKASGCLDHKSRWELQDLPLKTRTFLRAKDTEVVVNVRRCAHDGQCATFLQGIIEGMLQR